MAALNENKSGTTARSGQWLALLCAFSLAAGGGGSSDGSGASQSPLAQPPGTQPPPTPPAPTGSLSAAPTAVSAGGSTQLAWSSTNASACTANGAWSGTKATSGNQTISSISVTSTYGLICTGTGGSTTRSVTASVNAPPWRSAPVKIAGRAGVGGGVDSSLLNRHQ